MVIKEAAGISLKTAAKRIKNNVGIVSFFLREE